MSVRLVRAYRSICLLVSVSGCGGVWVVRCGFGEVGAVGEIVVCTAKYLSKETSPMAVSESALSELLDADSPGRFIVRGQVQAAFLARGRRAGRRL
jgi:hypothetical protein